MTPIEAAVLGRKTVKQALDDAAREIDQAVADDNPTMHTS